jgi:hypothetical protein
VLIAVIGNNWLTSKDDQGHRRLDNPEDFVRMEIGAALKREISVIPVLVDAALMPRAIDFPEDLKSLVRRNALRITDTSFDGDCQRLAAAIRLILEKAAAVEQERPAATLTPPAQPQADKPSTETPKVIHPLPPKPSAQERVKHPRPSSGGTEGKSPSKQVIAFLAIGAVLVVARLIYFAVRAFQSPPPQPPPVAAVTPNPPAIATPTVEEKPSPTPQVAVQPTAQVAISPNAATIPPTPSQYFNDYVGVIASHRVAYFNDLLARFERETSNQILVAIYPKLGPNTTIEQFTKEAFRAWKRGQAGRNNGVLFLFFVDDRKVRIQTGLGLEKALPDKLCEEILATVIIPNFRKGDYDGASKLL